MLRRRPDLPPADRLAVILGMPSEAAAAVAPAPLAGWVPQRSSVARLPFGVPPVGVPPVVVLPVVVPPVVVAPVATPRVAVPAAAFWAAASWAPAGLPKGELLQTEWPKREVPKPVWPQSELPQSELPQTGLAPELPQTLLDNGRHRRPGPPKPAVLTVPVALRGIRARPRRLAVLGVLVLLVAVAIVFGIRVAWASSSAKPESVRAAAYGPPGGLVSRTVPAAFATTGATGSPTPTANATAAGVLVVDVVGQVRRAGVVRLPPGSRVLDAVEAAGGAKASADLNLVNLARVLVDGEQIVVPKPGEIVPGAPGPQGVGAGATGPGSTGGAAGALVNLNTADVAALDSLPGVGPVLSQRIADWRTAHGRFSTVDELGEVSGIGDKLLAQIRPKVTV
jgi:competence protein ComEA